MKDFNPAPETASIVSVTDRVTKVALGAPATAVHFLGDVAAFVGAEEHVTFADSDTTTEVAVFGPGSYC